MGVGGIHVFMYWVAYKGTLGVVQLKLSNFFFFLKMESLIHLGIQIKQGWLASEPKDSVVCISSALGLQVLATTPLKTQRLDLR